jgi:hypothetical protein
MTRILLGFLAGSITGWTLAPWTGMDANERRHGETLSSESRIESGGRNTPELESVVLMPSPHESELKSGADPSWDTTWNTHATAGHQGLPEANKRFGSEPALPSENGFAGPHLDTREPHPLEAAFLDDYADGVYSEDLHRLLSDALQSPRLSGVTVDDLECRSASCRLILADASARRGVGSLLDLELAAAIAARFDGQIELAEKNDAWGRSIFYVSSR